MNPRLLVSCVVAALVAAGAVFAIANLSGDPSSGKDDTADTADTAEPTGPQPKAVIDSVEYDFGAMEVGSTMECSFTIRNEGEGPLDLGNGGTSCGCIKNLLEDTTLQPGEEAEVKLTWTPTVTDDQFLKYARVRTSDLDREEIELAVKGIVDSQLNVEPTSWDVGGVPVGETATVFGRVYSRVLDEFSVAIEDADEIDVTEPVPMTEEELAVYGAKSGWTYKGSFTNDVAGSFSRTFTLKSDVGDGSSYHLKVTGRTLGPINVLPIGGVRYDSREQAINLGRFPAAEGASGSIAIIMRGVTEDQLHIDEAVVTPDFLEFEMKRDRTFLVPNKLRYELRVGFPAGHAPDVKLRPQGGKVVIPTDHPEMPELEFHVEYVAE